MMDITDRMQSYRECVRYIWNTHFRAEAEQSQDWDLRDDFCDAALMLFRALVLRGLDVGEVELLPEYSVVAQNLFVIGLNDPLLNSRSLTFEADRIIVIEERVSDLKKTCP